MFFHAVIESLDFAVKNAASLSALIWIESLRAQNI
jgi:hypothetical protein